MSTKKEKCCEKCNHPASINGTPSGKETCVHSCHQSKLIPNMACGVTDQMLGASESIEWEERFETEFVYLEDGRWTHMVPAYDEDEIFLGMSRAYMVPSAIKDFISKAITTAVAKRELEIADEVKKLYSLDYMKGSPASYINRVLDQVLQILKH